VNIVLFEPQEIGRPLPLEDDRARHIMGILGKKEGDAFDAGVINAKAGTARITRIERGKGGGIFFDFEEQSLGNPLYPLKMIAAFPRPIQLKRLFRDMAGLGVAEIHLCGSDLGEKSYMQSRVIEGGAARRLLIEGTQQAKSAHVPELFLHSTLENCLDRVVPIYYSTHLEAGSPYPPLLAAPDNVRPACSLRDLLAKAGSLKSRGAAAAIGGERGWTDREREALTAAGFTLCGLGARILRTETAATVAASLILSAMEVV
jgi:RsmE family RNA methyltransferase